MNKVRKLDVSEIDFRAADVRSYNNKHYVNVLAYKDARVDMNVLDETFGPMNWQNEYKRDNDQILQCGIGVYNETTKEYVWKWSNGTASQFEKAKGEYSDAFKRAGFMWGVGRELYDFPRINVELLGNESYQDKNSGKVKVGGFFKPNDWNWEVSDKHVKATDEKGRVRVDIKNVG